MQISHRPFPFVIIDLRDSEHSESIVHGVAVKMRLDDVTSALKHDGRWLETGRGPVQPAPHHAIIFISDIKVCVATLL